MIIYTPPARAANIPVVDLNGMFSEKLDDRKRVAWEIHKACRETGFFYVSHHRISETLMAAQLDWAAKFFARPIAEKLPLDFAKSPQRLGYEPMLRQVLDAGSAPDLKESYMYAQVLRGGPEVTNQWPQLDGFREQMSAYHRAVGELGSRLMRGIALSLDLAEDFFDDAYAGTQFGVRLLHYPPQTDIAAGNQIGAGAHTDWGGITLLLQDDRGGLEVRNAAGDWIRATPIAGTFVINLGDLMRRWTNDTYKSTLHRVLNNQSGRDRYSVATFFGPRDDARITCIPGCAQDHAPLYAPITAGEHIAEMARRSYGS